MLMMFFIRETVYLTQKCEISLKSLPNVRSLKDWTIMFQQKQL